MKVALVYTSTTPELIELVEKEVGAVLPSDTEVVSYEDPSILAEVRDAGYVNLCSSVGEVADAAQEIGRYTGIPIVRVDEEMCREAVRQGRRIGVMATLPTTLNPTKNTIARVAREMNRQVELVDALVDGAFGLDQEQFKGLMSGYAEKLADQVDVILFAQGSMAYCEGYIHEKYGKVVLSSPRFGAAALKGALVKKGLL